MLGMRGGQAAGAPPQYYAPPADAYQEMPPETPEMNLEPWLDTTYYQEALDGFNIYDPTLWLPTIRFSVKGMMFWPWFLISLSTFLLAYDLLSLHPEHVDLIRSHRIQQCQILTSAALRFHLRT